MKSPNRWPSGPWRNVTRPPRRTLALLVAVGVAGWLGAAAAYAQERGPTPVPQANLEQAIGKLGDLDYATRSAAARTIRRAPPSAAVPLLLQAAREHADGYIRFKALVILTGFNDPRTPDVMEEVLDSPNDRLREVAYGYFEHNPRATLAPRLLAGLDKETSEFVRPSLVRALAALGADARVRDALVRDTARGQDYFRSSVIEAVGDYKVSAAESRLLQIAKLDGPLQDDAVVALGKIGNKANLGVLAELQRTAPQILQPAVASAICLMGQNCGSHIGFLQKTLGFAEDHPGFQELLRGAANGLGAIGAQGNAEAVSILLDVGVPSQDPVRAPVALALGMIAVRNTKLLLEVLAQRPDQAAAISIVAEGFDMLEEDLEEERFFATVRRTYWSAPDGSPARGLCEQLITNLDF